MDIMKIFADTAYVRMGGSAEELRCAEYLKEQCAKLGMEATIEPFEVPADHLQGLFQCRLCRGGGTAVLPDLQRCLRSVQVQG